MYMYEKEIVKEINKKEREDKKTRVVTKSERKNVEIILIGV